MIYIYDSSFGGLLTLINYLIKNKIKPYDIKDESYSPSLLEKTFYPKINDEELIQRIIDKIGIFSFKVVYCVFLSSNNNKELLIYYFLLNSLKYKEKICYMRNLKCVSECLKISQYVKRENHKYKGFVRFKELNNNVLYSEIEPENDILFLLCTHFKERLKNERWIINDLRRGIVGVYDKKKLYILDSTGLMDKTLKFSDEENNYQEMWKEFYKTIGIKERKNDRCRINFMPKKYWKHILEMEEI